ncbi:MAG: PAS domain-containing sensor histidine kinase [Betaproteobacteria bacterium]|nr:MAG: PAS domain-containing sensor histidine kinase [Betaproteobacteria bacterium]
MTPITAAAESASPPAPADAEAMPEPRLLLADRVAQLYRQLPIGAAATLLIVVISVYALRRSDQSWIVYGWSSVALAITTARVLLWWNYQRSTRTVEQAQRWMRWLTLGAIANGLIWGLLASLFFELMTEHEHLFIVLVLGGVMVGGIAVYASSWFLFAAYGAPIVLPFTYGLATHDDGLVRGVAILIPLFYAVSVGVAYRLEQLFLAGFRTQRAYRQLNAEYAALNQRLAQQLQEIAVARGQVEASGRKLALFVQRSPVAVFELDPQGRALNVNPAAEHLLGFAASELSGRPVAQLLFAPEQAAELLARWRQMLRARQPVMPLRQITRRRDGHEIVCEWSLTPLVNAEGRVISVIAQGRDITQQLEAERLKQEFTSTLSHELRTPLTAVLGALQLVNSGAVGSPDAEVRELTQIAERNSQRLLELINDVLDLEKVEAGKLPVELQAMPLEELVRESLTLNRAYGERFGVRFAMSDELPSALVHADRRRVLQVMTNLLSNAAKFSPQGATVEVTLQDLGSHLRVGVHDRGPGIPHGFHARIFSRFAQADMSLTREKGGTGLGLAICKRLVELMGGRIGFSARAGGGTTFWFELPKHAAAVP